MNCDAVNPYLRAGFNLSILECKLQDCHTASFQVRSFNLSILVCKFDTGILSVLPHPVLIYPYWNVNITAHTINSRLQ